MVFPIGVHHVQAMTRLIGLNAVQKRNAILVAVGTVMCARPSEPANVQTCDVHWGFDAVSHARYADGVGLRCGSAKTTRVGAAS